MTLVAPFPWEFPLCVGRGWDGVAGRSARGLRRRESPPSVIVAINQPYWIPYLGYFSLLDSADAFVVLDSVSFPRRGWVARNILHTAQGPVWTSIPLVGASQNLPISELMIDYSQPWREKFVRSLKHLYKQTSSNRPVFQMIDGWLDSRPERLSPFLAHTIAEMSKNLGIETRIHFSDTIFQKASGLSGPDRIISICEQLGGSTYLNLPSGAALYDESVFQERSIQLRFLPSLLPDTPDPEFPFRSTLSLLLELGFEGVRERLDIIKAH